MKALNIDLESEYRKRFLFYEPYPQQLAFHNAGATAFQRLFLAGNRTGKTYCGTVEDAIHLTGRYPTWWKGKRFNHPVTGWVASENYEITRNVLQKNLLGGFFHGEGLVSGLIDPSLIIKKAPLSGVSGAYDYAQIRHVSSGVSTVYFKSYKQGREKFQSARCHFIHLDEEPPKDIYTECLMRLADVDGDGQGVMILTETPLKGFTEMVGHYLLKDRANDNEDATRLTPEIVHNGKWYIQATWDDNPYLSEHTKQELRATLKPHELEARERGIPCIGTGLVYQVPESEFLCEPFDIPRHWGCVYGMDVGFFAPTAVVFLAFDRDNDIVYIYKDYSVTEKTAAQHAYSLMMMGAEWMQGVCDPAVNQGSQRDGERLLDDYTRAGLKLNKSRYAKELAVDTVLERIRTGRFKVFNTCRRFMDEWRGYSRDDKGKIMKGNDHIMNALEFVILDGLPMAKTQQETEMRYSYNNRPRFF